MNTSLAPHHGLCSVHMLLRHTRQTLVHFINISLLWVTAELQLNATEHHYTEWILYLFYEIYQLTWCQQQRRIWRRDFSWRQTESHTQKQNNKNQKKIKHKQQLHMNHLRLEMGENEEKIDETLHLSIVRFHTVLPSFAERSFFDFCFLFFASNANSAMQTHKLITNKCSWSTESCFLFNFSLYLRRLNDRISKQSFLNFFRSLASRARTLHRPFMIASKVQCAFVDLYSKHSVESLKWVLFIEFVFSFVYACSRSRYLRSTEAHRKRK